MTAEKTLLPQAGSKLVLEKAFKQFSLETQRLEFAYKSLEEKFDAIQKTLYDSQTRLSAKLSELDFVSRYLETILHHMSQGILFVDLHGIVTTYNEAAEKILGFATETILFHSLKDFVDDAFFGFSIETALRDKTCQRFTYLSWNKTEGTRTELEVESLFVAMEKQTQPIDLMKPGSPVQGLLILIRDITEMRRLQQEAHRNSRLQELGEMAAHLAHEIRNPLGGIRGFASLLYQDLQNQPEQQKLAQHVIEGTADLNGFVTNILNYTRPLEARLEVVNIVPFIEDLRQLMLADSTWNPQTRFTVKSDFAELLVPFDAPMLKSALLNLIVNAGQAMPEGGGLTIQIGSDREHAILKIKDTGVGIPPEHLDKIFSPFFTTKEKGTGLGLSEVHKVIQAHQGSIEVRSNTSDDINRGTLFIIKLPLKN